MVPPHRAFSSFFCFIVLVVIIIIVIILVILVVVVVVVAAAFNNQSRKHTPEHDQTGVLLEVVEALQTEMEAGVGAGALGLTN